MPPQIDSKDAETVLTILNRSIAIESELTRKFGAEGSGLNDKATFCEHLFHPGFVRKIRYIASVRNKLSHEAVISTPIAEYIRACDVIDQAIAAVPATVKSQVEAEPIPTKLAQASMPRTNPSQQIPIRRFPRIISYPLMLGALFWGVTTFLRPPPVAVEPTPVKAPTRPAFVGSVPFVPTSAAQKKAYRQSRLLEELNEVPRWGFDSPGTASAPFDWRTAQAAYDKSHADPVAGLPNETYWVPDTSEAGMKQMKEVRKLDSRVIQVPVLLGGNSGLKATLEFAMQKPAKGNAKWIAYSNEGVLKFGVGKEVPIPGIYFVASTGSADLIHFQMSEVFDCPKYDEDGCLGWTLNQQVSGVFLSKRSRKYAGDAR